MILVHGPVAKVKGCTEKHVVTSVYSFSLYLMQHLNFPSGSAVKNLPAMHEPQEMWVQSLGWEDPLKEEKSNPLPYACLENPMDRGAWKLQFTGSQRVGLTEVT